MNSVSEKSMVPPGWFCRYCKKPLPPSCPKCKGLQVTCNGKAGDRQKYRCECGHQFISNPSRRHIDDRDWQLIDSLLGDGAEVSMIHRAFGISKRHIYYRKKAMGIS